MTKYVNATPTQQENIRLRRAKKLNVATSTASGTLGIAALGALGAKTAPGMMARAGRTAGPRAKAMARRADNATVPLSAASLGVGGLGSLNFARVQNQEANRLPKWDRSRKRVVMPVSKARALPVGPSFAARAGRIVDSTAGPKAVPSASRRSTRDRILSLIHI